MTKIAIIISSTRPTRFADKPAKWILEIAKAHSDWQVELLDLRDYKLPFFEEVASNAWTPTQNPEGVRWQKKLAEFDGYIFVVAEYNRSITAALKNALDYAYPEWNKKPAAYVAYGSLGGARATEHLRNICVELQMAPVRAAVHIMGADFMALAKGEKTFADMPYLEQGAKDMLTQFKWWVDALKTARSAA